MFKKLRATLTSRRKKTAKVVAAATIAAAYEPTIIPLAAITDVVLPQPAARQRDGHLGMQGYAPLVAISVGRRYCEFCGDRVGAGTFHVCWGNAEHHMAKLTRDDRVRIMEQLARRPKKLTRAQLKKLYAADGLGPARY